MSGFDFRDILGGGSAKVSNDPHLADGIDGYDKAADQHWLMLSKRDGMPCLVEHLTRTIILNANTNSICCAGLMALIVARMGQIAHRDLPTGEGARERHHILNELQGVLDAMRRGDA